jgi:hypothetical protein
MHRLLLTLSVVAGLTGTYLTLRPAGTASTTPTANRPALRRLRRGGLGGLQVAWVATTTIPAFCYLGVGLSVLLRPLPWGPLPTHTVSVALPGADLLAAWATAPPGLAGWLAALGALLATTLIAVGLNLLARIGRDALPGPFRRHAPR